MSQQVQNPVQSNVATNSNKTQNEPWLRLLAEVISKHWLALIFVILISIVFRMQHLSDLTVVVIQLERHTLVMLALYAAIIVLAVLISYGQLVEINLCKKRKGTDKKVVNTNQVQEKKTKRQKLKGFAIKLNPQDSMEASLKQHPNQQSGQIAQEESSRDYVFRVYPKFLATFMIISIAFTVEQTHRELYGGGITWRNSILFIALLLVAFTNPNLSSFVKTKLKWKFDHSWFPIVIIVLSLVVIIILGINNRGGSQSDIRHLFWSMMCLAMIFFTFSISYNKRLLKFKELVITPIIYILIISMLFIYINMFISPELDALKKLTPIVILLVCLIGLYTIFTVLTLIGRSCKFPILTIIFFGAIMLTIVTAKNQNFKHYEVTAVETIIQPDDRMDLDAYVEAWIATRYDAIAAATKKKPFPIVLVSAEGGGSRAGHWAWLVHSYLYEQNKKYFDEHLFSITGASGGSVGSNIFYAQAYENRNKNDSEIFKLDNPIPINSEKTNHIFYKASDFYQKDYISSSIAGLLGRDLAASIFNFSGFLDRGRITELEWERESERLFNNKALSQPYLNIMPKETDTFIPPIMVTTTTHVQTGRLFVISPVKLEPNNFNEPQFQDLLGQYAEHHTDSMITRSSAMLLTARFPYLSPNGRITCIGQFGDGGYYDNIGGVVTQRLEQALVKALDRSDLCKKYRIKHLIIKNNPSTCFSECQKEDCKEEVVNYESQLVSPAKMVINATFSPADEFVDAHSPEYRVESKRTLINLDDSAKALTTNCDDRFRPLIPLGRYLSMDAVYSLEVRLNKAPVKNQLDSLLMYNLPSTKQLHKESDVATEPNTTF